MDRDKVLGNFLSLWFREAFDYHGGECLTKDARCHCSLTIDRSRFRCRRACKAREGSA